MKFWGHRVTAEGTAPDPGKVEALRQLPMPTNVSQLRSLLGGLSYYRKFLPKMAAVTKTLNELLKKGVAFVWTQEHTQIVQTLLERLSSLDVLAFPDFDAAVDGLGAVVEQEQQDGTVRPICFLSRSTLPNEHNWSAMELECAAII